MLFWLTQLFQEHMSALRVFQYLTFRSILAALTALLLALLMGPVMIRWLQRMQLGQMVRDDGPQSHLSKAGTPTMGGALILGAVSISTLLWGDLSNRNIWLALFVLLGFGAIGWMDDYRKIIRKNSKGLSAKAKYTLQSLIGGGVAVFLYMTAASSIETQLLIPFFKDAVVPLGLAISSACVFCHCGQFQCGKSNRWVRWLGHYAYRFSCLGVRCVRVCVGECGAITLFSHAVYAANWRSHRILWRTSWGLALAFLWFNAYPAEVFMGDVGSLGLGAALGIIAVLVRQELVLLIMGGVFVMETVSVILQVGYYKLTKKRIFRMAPIHHHFELLGWPEPKVIVRFWVITFVLVLCGLATLKLR